MSKLSKDLTIEQLMEIAKKPIPLAKDLPDTYSDVNKFIMINSLISDEKNLVPTYIIYEHYIVWCDQNGVEPKHTKHFFSEFATYFNKVKKNGQIQYLVNGSGMDLSAYDAAKKQHLKQIYSKRMLNHGKKEKNKKA